LYETNLVADEVHIKRGISKEHYGKVCKHLCENIYYKGKFRNGEAMWRFLVLMRNIEYYYI
jgi:hypothetical protein